jgi:hypothetical protein
MRRTPKSVKAKLKQFSIKSSSGWDAAISEAERQLTRVNNRATRLRKVIEDFKQLQASGHPWPSDSGVQTTTST